MADDKKLYSLLKNWSSSEDNEKKKERSFISQNSLSIPSRILSKKLRGGPNISLRKRIIFSLSMLSKYFKFVKIFIFHFKASIKIDFKGVVVYTFVIFIVTN